METTVTCTVVAIDYKNVMYGICSTCERTLPDNTLVCNFSHTHSSSKRLFRILMSIATETKVFVVIMFDRAARVLFGCSADDFFDFINIHPFAAEDAAKVLEGEMIRATLSNPKNGNAQHQRVVSVLPLKSGFRPAIEELRESYKLIARS